MKLLTKAILNQFQKVGNQSTESNPLVICKFFYVASHRTWYATEYNSDDRIFFGYVVGNFSERGYFSLDELESFRGILGLRIERDRFFTPCKFNELAV